MIMIYLPKKAISGPYITILKLDMITKFMIEVEYYESDTTEKAFIFAGVNPKNYDLFHEKINVSKSDWNFKDAPLDTVYHFRENKWQYRRNLLFNFKNDKIRLPKSLKQEMISYI